MSHALSDVICDRTVTAIVAQIVKRCGWPGGQMRRDWICDEETSVDDDGARGAGLAGPGRGSRRASLHEGAAPAPPPTTRAPPPMMAAIYDWSGFYIGVNGGGGWGKNTWDVVGGGREG